MASWVATWLTSKDLKNENQKISCLNTMFISNNRASFHLRWKENLVKHETISKYYESECRTFNIFRNPSEIENIFIWTKVFSNYHIKTKFGVIFESHRRQKCNGFYKDLCPSTLDLHFVIVEQ